MPLDDWLGTGTLNLPFSATESMNSNPNCTIADGVLYIDDSENGDGGPPARVEVAVNEADPHRSLLVIKSLISGQVRVNVGGEHGAWRSIVGIPFNETITAGPSFFIEVEYAPYTVCAVSLVLVQPATA